MSYQEEAQAETLEQLFIEEYRGLSALVNDLQCENAELREKLEKDNGFTDLGIKFELIKVNVIDYFDLFVYSRHENSWLDLDAEELNRILELEDAALLKKCKETGVGIGIDKEKIIEIEYRSFPFALVLSTYKGKTYFAYDPDLNESKLYIIHSDKLGEWCYKVSARNIESLALNEVRSMIKRRIKELEKEKVESVE